MNSYNANNIFSLQYLILSLPFLIITGPFLSDFIVSLMAIYLIFQIKNVLIDKKFLYLFLFFSLFYILVNVSNFFSIYVNLNINSIFYFRFFLFSFSFILIIKDPVFFFKCLSIITGSLFIILFIDSLFEFFFHKNILGYDNLYPNRVSSFFKDELVLGSYTVRLLPILIGSTIFVLNKSKKYVKSAFIIFITIGLILILLSGERTSILLFLIFILYLTIFWKTKFLLKLILVSIIPLFFIFTFSKEIRNRFLIEPLIQFNFVDQKTLKEKKIIDDKDFGYPEYTLKKRDLYIFSVHHHKHYLSAWKIFKEYPIIGAGAKSFRFVCEKDKFHIYNIYDWEYKIYPPILDDFSEPLNTACSTHPHNTHVQILSELGLLGYFFLLSIIFMIVFFSIKIKKNKLTFKYPYMKDLTIFLLGACFMNLWPIAPSGNFFNNWLSILYYFPFGLVLYCFSQRVKKNLPIAR
tara:strand:- start:1105 stop:2496 length:1392 start_codon:yes stop_codon:yes gene_type:complete